jgi:thymidylate synthase
MNKLDKQYQELLQSILDYGVEKQDRTGTGTKSIFGYTIRHNMRDGFPLLTTKKMAWKTMVTELLWFLRGDTNIKFLVDNGCHIWDGDAYMNYLNNSRPNENDKDFHETRILISKEDFINKIKTDDEFAKKWGELGPIYGKQWRSWRGKNGMIGEKDEDGVRVINWEKIDQIKNLMDDLKTNPDSRRLMVTAWNPSDLDSMVLPPCHYGFQVYTRELSLEERLCIADKFNPLIREDCLTKTHHPDETEELKLVYRHEFLDSLGPNVVPQRRAISLMWNQRSVDTFLGLPFNIASYGLLLEIIAKAVNMVPDELVGNLGDVHLYSNHIEQAKEQIGRELSLEERTELAKGKVVPLLGSKEDSYNEAGIPTRTREPFELPTLNMAKTNAFWNGFDVSLLGHLDPTDFTIENYQSHPSIKAPLSN